MELEVSEGPRIFGIGVGLFLLILLWSFTIIGVLLCSRLSTGAVTAIISLTALVTGVLIAVPRDPPVPATAAPKTDEADDVVVYDRTFVPRIVLIVFFAVVTVGVGSYTLVKKLTRQVYAEVVVAKKYN